MADGLNTKSRPHTSTPAPNRKTATTSKLFRTSLALSPLQEKTTMLDMVIKAITIVGLPRKGASLPAIKKWILANSDPSSRNQAASLKKAILKGIESGIISRASHCKDAYGVTGSFILVPTSKKVKRPSNGKEIMQKAVKSQESNAKAIKPSTEKVKKEKPVENMEEAIKKISKKNVKSETGTVAKETKKQLSPSIAITKNVTKKNTVTSKTSKKGTKKDMGSLTKMPAKEGSKNEPSTSNANSESGKNIKRPDQEPELTKQKKNKTEALKKEKAIKTKEKSKIKDSVSKNTLEKGKVVQPRKRKENLSNVKDFTKQSNKTAAKKTADLSDDLDMTRKDMSDTELDKKPNRLKSLKSYASDTELEISRRTTPQSKKIKPVRKALTKKV